MPANDLRVLTSSELKTFRRCPREHRLSYVQLVRPAERAAALRFGTLVHAALEAWWRATTDRLIAALAVIAAAVEIDVYERAKAEALLLAYDTRWRDEPLEVLGVELEFETAVVNPATGAASKTFRQRGKVDALVRHVPSGRVLIVEHKTSSEDFGPGSTYVQRLRLDSQVSTYYGALRDLGHDVAGCLYDVIGKPRHVPALATPEADRKFTREIEAKPCPPKKCPGEACEKCHGTGTIPGVPSRLYAGQRDTDESVEEYQARILDAIAAEPDRYLARVEVVRLEAEELEARGDLWSTARVLRENELAGRAPRNPDACMRWGRACEFFPICTGETTADDTTRYRRAEQAHEELSTPTEGAA